MFNSTYYVEVKTSNEVVFDMSHCSKYSPELYCTIDS